MGDLAGAIGNGIQTLVSRLGDIVGTVVDGVVRTFNAVLPGSAVLAVVAIVIAVFVVWAIRKP